MLPKTQEDSDTVQRARAGAPELLEKKGTSFDCFFFSFDKYFSADAENLSIH